jgi:hypothetical protein
VITASQ